MLVLFDHGTPKGLARTLVGHTVYTAQSRGWDTLSNGELLNAAEEAGFDVLLTTDRRICHQQNLKVRRIALVVLTGSTEWSGVRQHTDRIGAAVSSATSGSYSEVEIPLETRSRVSDTPGPTTALGVFALIKIEEEPVGGCEQVLVRRSIVSRLGYATRQFGEQFGPVPIR